MEIKTKMNPNKNAGSIMGINRIPIKFIGLIKIYANTIAETAPEAPRPL